MIDFIREFDKESLKNKFDKDLDEIPVWIWLFWLPVLFENFNNYQYKEEKNDLELYKKERDNKLKQIEEKKETVDESRKQRNDSRYDCFGN